MTLPVQSFDQAVKQQQEAMQAAAGSSVILDFETGSTFDAIIEANSGLFMWLQAIAVALNNANRLATSYGVDVDTFVRDYGYARAPGNPSSGLVNFSRLTNTVQAVVPIGAVVSVSAVNNLNFLVIVDVTNPNYDSTANGYVLGIGISSISVPIQCQLSGSIGNVLPGQIDTIDSSIVGVDFVNNPSALNNGVDPASDAAVKLAFPGYVQSLDRATKAAISYIVSTTKNIKRYNLVELQDTTGAQKLGYFYVVVDDGTGVSNSQLIADASALVETYRGLTIQYNVVGPTSTTVTVSMTITLIANPSSPQGTITTNIQNALILYVQNNVGFNSILPYTRLAEIIYDADPNILNVSSILLNGATADLTTDNTHLLTLISSGVTVSYST